MSVPSPGLNAWLVTPKWLPFRSSRSSETEYASSASLDAAYGRGQSEPRRGHDAWQWTAIPTSSRSFLLTCILLGRLAAKNVRLRLVFHLHLRIQQQRLLKDSTRCGGRDHYMFSLTLTVVVRPSGSGSHPPPPPPLSLTAASAWPLAAACSQQETSTQAIRSKEQEQQHHPHLLCGLSRVEFIRRKCKLLLLGECRHSIRGGVSC